MKNVSCKMGHYQFYESKVKGDCIINPDETNRRKTPPAKSRNIYETSYK